MTKITLHKSHADAGWVFDVDVHENNSSTRHKVAVTRDFFNRLGTSVKPEVLVRESFKFLLERESKESILGSFDLAEISTYFPEYLDEIKKRLN